MKLSLFFMLIGVLSASTKPITWRRISWKFLQKEPLDLDFCKGLGYDFAATMNFFLERNTSGFVSNTVFRALSLLDRTSCSKLIKPYTCGLLAPPFTGASGVIPPCRSLCQTAEESCKPILNFFSKFSPIQYDSCKHSQKGVDFRGKINKTEGNLECQRWNSQYPHKHSRTPEKYPDEDLEKNYCRNPDGEPGGPWCYTMSKRKRWGYCKIPMCPGPLFCEMLPVEGCVEWKYNETLKSYEREIIGTPKVRAAQQWLSVLESDVFNLQSLKDFLDNVRA